MSSAGVQVNFTNAIQYLALCITCGTPSSKFQSLDPKPCLCLGRHSEAHRSPLSNSIFPSCGHNSACSVFFLLMEPRMKKTPVMTWITYIAVVLTAYILFLPSFCRNLLVVKSGDNSEDIFWVESEAISSRYYFPGVTSV